MSLSFTIPVISILFPLLMKQQPEIKSFEYKLQGLITNKQTGKPLSNVYLYSVKGEEEAITDEKGEFKLITWKKLPVTIHIQNKNEEVRVVITNPSEFLKIKL